MHYFEYSSKRPSHNSRSYEYTNEEFRFVTSAVVKRTKPLLEYFDADIFGTHARGDIAWRRIPAEKIMAPECIIFNFRKPENYAHFKLETIGAFLPENEFDPHFTFISPRYVEHNIRQFTKTKSRGGRAI
jgi:hypothetical protein